MAGLFDDLIGGAEQQSGAGLFDDLKPESSITRRLVGDTAITALKSAIAVPEIAVGIGDLVTGGRAGKAAEQAGFRPKEAKAFLDDYLSPEQKAANEKLAQADGFVDTLSTAVDNPSTILHTGLESIAPMLAGGVVARGLMAAPAVAGKLAPWAAGAMGEGVVGAGMGAESIRQQTEDGLLTGEQAGLAGLAGVGTGLIGAGGAKIAQKLGIGEIDTLLAGGNAGAATTKGIARKAAEGAAVEGVFQELPQSTQEQALQNIALGKPWDQGLGNAAAMGLLTGAALGGIVGPLGGKSLVQPQPTAENPAPAPVPAPDPAAGPISRTAAQLPGPSIAGLLPDPGQTLYGDAAGNLSPDGPSRNVDREYRPTGRERGPQTFGPGMDQQREAGKTYKGLPAANRAIRESANPEQLEAVKVGPQTFEVRPKAAEQDAQRPVLQNRDRSTPASITQMRSIAARPDYQRVSISRDFANGAPVVEPGAAVPSSRKGRTEVVSTASGRKINTQYAVVEASDLLPSHDINGGQNAEYATGAQGKSRAIAGNGRVTGISHAYTQGTAGEYRRELEADAAGHGISPEAIKGMKQPVLVRIMPQDQITQNIGDESNTTGVSGLSGSERAMNDARRINIDDMEFSESGEISETTVRQFVQSMPDAERNDLLDGARPSRQAYDRAESAIFASAYESESLIELQAQAKDPEVRTVLAGLLVAAPKMARLKGAGEWDIRGLVVEAAEAAVNARRNGQTLEQYAQQVDLDRNPEAQFFIELFAENIRSAKRIGEELSAVADGFYTEVTKPEFDMLGAVPRRSRQDLLNGAPDADTARTPANSQTAGNQAGPGTAAADGQARDTERAEPAGAGADAQAEAFQLNQQTEEELAAADAANKARIKAEEKAEAEAEQKALADRDRNDFTLTGSDRPSDVAAARGQNDMFAPPTRGEKKAQQEQAANNVPEADRPASTSERQPIRFVSGQPASEYLADGSNIEDGNGQQYRVHYQRNDLVVAHPIVDGKAQVNAESSVRFHVGDPASADERRTDPIYLVEGRSQQAPESVGQQLASMDANDLSALIDEVSSEIAAPQTSKPKAKRSTKAKTAEGKPRIRPAKSPAERTDTANSADVTRTAGAIAKSMGVNMSKAGMNALEGLTQLFGGPGRLNSGLSFDEETYAKAKPYFAAAMADVQAAGKDLRDFIRALLSSFGDGVKPYILRYAEDLKQEQQDVGANSGVEPDSAQNAEQGAGANVLGQEPGETRPTDRQLGDQGSGTGAGNADGVSAGGSATDGERGNQQVDGEQPAVEAGSPGSADGGRGNSDSTGGLFAERNSDEAIERAVEGAVTPGKANVKPSNKPGTVDEIKAQMPFLTDGQAEDVAFAERRLSKPDGYGVLYTNGTGTGKTFSGLGIAARANANGKSNILIAVPKQTIADAWVKAGDKFFGLPIKVLDSTKDNGGSGIVVTTYANLGANPSLALREWDMVIADEAHYLSSSEDGATTNALENLRALTKRRGYARNLVRLRESEKVARLKSLTNSIEQREKEILDSGGNAAVDHQELARDTRERDELIAELDALYEAEESAFKAMKPEDAPRGVLLSATPFAYEKNVHLAQQFLFDWGSNDDSSQAYNSGGPFERFMMQHFGYRMRYNKLTEPDAKVDRGLMQRAFNSWLKREGALSARALESAFDYDRKFVTLEAPIGRRVDDALKWLRNRASNRDEQGNDLGMSVAVQTAYRDLQEKIVGENFNYHARMYFLEAIKAREALPHIRAHLAKGRKVVVMHDFKQGGVGNPFIVGRAPDNQAFNDAVAAFSAEFSDLQRAFSYLPSPIAQLTKAFPNALVYNGDYSAKKRVAMQNAFNDDSEGAPNLIIAQGDAMREGVSIHDTTGKHQRVLVHLGMPVKPTAAIQQEGRIYRTGQASHALFRYFTIGTAWERSAFASKIAMRAGAAENLAMGEQARGLKQAFIDAYEAADLYEPGFDGEGTGGKDADFAAAQLLTPWDTAKSFYFGTKTQGKGRSSAGREGNDYFATPEPLGLKMVEWADIRGGESVLEPSAGHGAIARWFPDAARVRVIEHSADLASRVSLHVQGDVIHGRFEDHHVVNKYDGIVMNPPFGLGGAVAIPHLAKAADHLREGGRVVALIPTGPAADKKFDNWLYGLDKNGKPLHPDLHLIADVKLPGVTFERAGTSVATRIVIIEKVSGEQAEQLLQTRQLDLSSVGKISELFDRLENMEMPARLKPVEEEAEQTAPSKSVTPKEPKQSYAEKAAAEVDKYVTDAPIIEHTTAKGKVLRGVVVRDMSLAEVKEKFYEFAFKKDGGVFLRAEFVQRPGVESPRGSYTTGQADRQFVSEPTATESGYETDLFGNPIPAPRGRAKAARSAGAGVRGDVQPASTLSDTPTPAGRYHVKTIVGTEVSRRLGADRINSFADLAQATQYLYRSAVERFDGIVTDKDGKPLAVVGGFKGAIDSASVPIAPVIAEAVRVRGAANIWLSHNHPSGLAELSPADRNLHRAFEDAFAGSGIEVRGLIAVGRGEYGATDNTNGRVPAEGNTVSVPVIEREQVGEPLDVTIESPAAARAVAAEYYEEAGRPGMILLDSRHRVTGWAPFTPSMTAGPLRNTGGLNALYRAVSEGNAAAAILVHGGELDTLLVGTHDSGMNIAAGLNKAGVRVLDVINAETRHSRAEKGGTVVGSTLYRLSDTKAKGIPLFSARAIAKKVMAATGLNATVVNTEADLPADLQAQIKRDKATGRVAGVYHNGTAYLVASNLRDTKHAVSVMLHEAVGHGGVKSVLGDRLGKVMAGIYRDMPAAIRKELERRYASQIENLSKADANVLIAEEYVAHLAETDPQHSVINRLVALLRRFIRDTFGESMSMKWTRNDIVQLLAEARVAARSNGRGPKGAGRYRKISPADALAALPEVDAADESAFVASLKADAANRSFASAMYKARGTESPFFKAWFGKSRMVDKQGQPIAFVHRSYGERDSFTDSDLGKNTGTPTAALGHFLARKDVGNVERYGPVVEQFYIRMEKPKVITQAQFEAMGDWSLTKVQAYRKTLMDQGHDGLYIQGLSWPVVFEGKNIKARRNQGTFDASERTRYNITEADFAAFDGAVDALARGKTFDKPIVIGRTPEVLKALGAADAPINISEDALWKAIDKHSLTPRDIKSAVKGIGSPVMVFDSATAPDGLVVLVEAFSRGRPVVVAVHLNRKENIIVNRIASMHAKDSPQFVRKWLDDGLLRYVDNKKADEWFSTIGLQLPKAEPKHRLGKKILRPADIDKLETDERGDTRYSLNDDAATAEALRKLGLGGKDADGMIEQIRSMTLGGLKAKLAEWSTRSEEGLFDGLAGIKRAEEAVGVNDANQQGYVSARMATGIADVMHGVLHYAAPEWRDGVIAGKENTRGVLEILGDLGQDNLTPWLAWLGGKRAQMLKAQGRENNLTDADIAELLAMGKGKEALFEKVYRDYAKTNEAVLDLAEGAGLIDRDARAKWATEYYVPFYRQDEAEGIFTAPRTKRGLSHQTAAIKALKGGKLPTNDLLTNMLTGWTKRIDAAMKNKALLEVVDNLKGSEFLSDESPRFQQVLISRSQIAQQIRKDRKALAMAADMLGLPEGSKFMKVANQLMKPENEGFEKLWTKVAPTDPDIIRVQRGGKNEYYRVNDESLLRGLKFMEGSVFNDPITRIGRAFKRLLTTGVTASPDFILRNFIRDAAHAWMINKDGFVLGKDSIKGMRDALREDQDYRDLMFAGGSFQGGYVHGTDPEASAQIIRRALEKKGFSKQQQDSYLGSLVNTPAKAAAMLGRGWQSYRTLGDKVENANRLSTYKAALAAGKSKRQAAFEAKDLMDYSLRGNFAAAQWFTDVVPFLNARLQGLYKLGRAMKDDKTVIAKEVALKGAYIALFSLLLAGLNDDDERYQELQDWDKDMHWHIFLGDQHFRIPKPFELGLIFGTVPERLLHALTGTQDGGDLAKAVSNGVFQTLAFNPVPQFYQPIRELQANRNFFRDMPIEDMSDEGKLPEARFDERTSAIGRALGQVTGPTLGISPKQLDHLVQGYTGTLGGYVLGMSSLVAGAFDDAARPSARAGDLPVVKVLYQGDDVRSTKYQSQFYDMMREADQLHRTIKAYREEGRVDAAAQLLESSRDKLRHRAALGMARQQLGAVRKQMDAVYRDTSMSGEAKRAKLDQLQVRANQIAERIVSRAGGDF